MRTLETEANRDLVIRKLGMKAQHEGRPIARRKCGDRRFQLATLLDLEQPTQRRRSGLRGGLDLPFLRLEDPLLAMLPAQKIDAVVRCDRQQPRAKRLLAVVAVPAAARAEKHLGHRIASRIPIAQQLGAETSDRRGKGSESLVERIGVRVLDGRHFAQASGRLFRHAGSAPLGFVRER